MNLRESSSSQPLSGSIILSHPSLRDPNFLRSIVFLSNHSGKNGSLGVIINRPMGKTLGQLDPSFTDNPLANTPVYEGGPVEKQKLIIAAWEWLDTPSSFKLHFGIDPVQADAIRKSNPKADLICFAGHSGWSPGQLENELKENAWVIASLDKDMFAHREEDTLWKKIVGNVSDELRLLVDAPEDPSFN
jgi:putative transcriptional regulator